MIHHNPRRQRGAAAFAVSGPAAPPRRPTLSSADRLSELSSRLDELIRDVGLGAISHRQFEQFVAEAEAIADGIRAVFRNPTPPKHAPLKQSGGKAWW